MKKDQIHRVSSWPTDMLWSELRNHEINSRDLNDAICLELVARKVSGPDIVEFYPGYSTDANFGNPTPEPSTVEVTFGCLRIIAIPLFVIIFGVFIVYQCIAWINRQDSISESLGEVAHKIVSPISDQVDRFRKGYSK